MHIPSGNSQEFRPLIPIGSEVYQAVIKRETLAVYRKENLYLWAAKRRLLGKLEL